MAKPSTAANHDYEVGYQKPPKATRFKKGQSGNPNGRPKASLNLQTIVRQVLLSKVTVNDGGVRSEKTKLEVGLTRITNKAIEGDLAANKMMLGVATTMLVDDETQKHLTPDQIMDFEHAKKIAAKFSQKIIKELKNADE